jgi:hypothetical protein
MFTAELVMCTAVPMVPTFTAATPVMRIQYWSLPS